MRVSDIVLVREAGVGSRVLRDAVANAKAAIAEIYLQSSTRRLAQDNPFFALDIGRSQWETLDPTWRKSVRKLWRTTVGSRKQLLKLADSFVAELDSFLKQAESLGGD